MLRPWPPLFRRSLATATSHVAGIVHYSTQYYEMTPALVLSPASSTAGNVLTLVGTSLSDLASYTCAFGPAPEPQYSTVLESQVVPSITATGAVLFSCAVPSNVTAAAAAIPVSIISRDEATGAVQPLYSRGSIAAYAPLQFRPSVVTPGTNVTLLNVAQGVIRASVERNIEGKGKHVHLPPLGWNEGYFWRLGMTTSHDEILCSSALAGQ